MKIKAHLPNGDNNPAYYRDYYLKNRDRILGKNADYSKSHGSPRPSGQYRKMLVSILRQRDGHDCGICKTYVPNGKEEIDHIIPIAIGGAMVDATNLQITHIACNRAKKKTRQEWGITHQVKLHGKCIHLPASVGEQTRATSG